MKRKFEAEKIRKLWSNGNPITYKGKKYRVCKMSYGDYFLEPISWKGGETEGFSPGTLWLVKTKGLVRTKYYPYYYEVE